MIGFGVGAAMTAASTSIMFSAPEHSAGTAASIEEIAYELGGLIGVAVLGSLLVAIYTAAFTLPADIPVSESVSNALQNSIDEAIIVAEGLKGDMALSLLQAAKLAFDSAFLSVLTISGALLLLSATIIALFTPKKHS